AFNYVFRPSVICKHLPWVGNTANAEVKRNVNCDLYEMKVYVRKCIIGNGEDYRGGVSKTMTGRTCQQWWSKFPHDHRYTPSSTNGLELNYCRNPDGDNIGPWCYTTDPERRYESCNIPQCKDEVCITCNGEDYRGQVDRTVSGRECQRWDQQHPHQHIYQPEKYPDKSLDDNYCRNPDASPVPWCYTTDPEVERERCDIRMCFQRHACGYAPQVGCELEEKERFWSELDEVMESIPTGERVVIGADFNGHVGEGNTGDEEVMGKFGVKERNLEGQMVVDFAKRMDMGVVNTYFQKREEHRVTYKSGGRSTQVDYILCRRGNLKEISDCKVVVGESVARQHRMVVCRMTLMVCKKKRSEIEKKTKWWKLKKEECCEEFRQKLRQALGGQVVLPDDWETTAEVIRETGRKVLGVSSGRRKEDKETWWWNEEVQDSIQRKRLAKKKWDMDRTEENRQEYKELQRRVKREVSKAKQKAYDELYTRLDTREGEKDLYRLARQRDRDGKDVQQVRVIKDRDGRVLTSEESVQRRWKEYFEELMNEENEREKRVEGVNSVEQKVDKIRKDEVRKALKRMKSGKAVGPDDIPVEVWKCLGEAAVEFLASLFNRVLESERMPEEWRRSVLVPIFKNKGDVQSCSNYRGIKLMSHTMKLWERVVEARLRKVVEICEQQYGFMPRKSTTDAIFALRILMEKYRDGQRELHCVFVDLEKAYDRVPREELWYCMRKSGVAEKYVRVVQDMYERSRTVVRCAVGQTEEFNVEVGLHQGSALSPFLFAIVMDQLSEEVRQESPWTMMFADDIVICSESREQVEENLERWRFALERRGMKVSRSKTEYMCVNEREGSGTVRLQGEEVKKVQEFKYLGSTVQSNGECGKEVKKRVQAGWNGWRKVSGVLCDQKISARIKGKVYRTVVRPAMLYGLETVSLKKRQESELEVAELKMLRFSLGVTRLDRIRNEYIRGTAHVGHLGNKVREARLRWFGHVQRRESEYIGRRMLDMKLPGRRQRGRPKRRYMDGINEDMKLVGARVEDAEDRDRWREMIRSEVPKRRSRSSYTTNCFRDRGEDYRGKVNETTSGIQCQRWDAQFPHEHPFYPHTYECKGLEGNYCRNPDGSEAPWCFTSRSEMRTALCLQIKRCADDIEAEEIL
ncbi:hypothetical protein QTP70_024640, partial [Hemibagrus guttatus]